MATYLEQQYEGKEPSAEDIQDLMVQKAHELFVVCDKESKGFITKRDMQRLQAELPLSPEQLEAVFDSLDDDGNGFLTLEEFTDGFERTTSKLPGSSDEDSCVRLSLDELKAFNILLTKVAIYLKANGSFLGMTPKLDHQESVNSSAGSEKVYENEHNESGEEGENFDDLLDTIGGHGVFEDEDVIRSMWGRIRRDEPEILCNFEDFLARVTLEIKRSHSDLSTLESALKNKSMSHDEEVRKLYDEMENQIRMEKDRILMEEKARERHLRDEMDRELNEKEQQLIDFQAKQQEMEERLMTLNTYESETKQENEKLLREKEELEVLLVQSQRHLEESKSYINSMRHKHRDEKRERAMAALQISEGIAMERESLVKQLDMLRDMNKRLRDDKDEQDMRRDVSSLDQELAEAVSSMDSTTGRGDHQNDGEADYSRQSSARSASMKRRQMTKQGSVMSSYFGQSRSRSEDSSHLQPPHEMEEDGEVEYDDDLSVGIPSKLSSSRHLYDTEDESEGLEYEQDRIDLDPGAANGILRGTRSSISDIEDFEESDRSRRRRRKYRSEEDLASPDSSRTVHNGIPQSPREQPVGANDSTTTYESAVQLTAATPERVFKVVFVGDSGVGKSSFIHRFCNSEFKASFSATIGVDFQVKSILVDGHCVALQLWDTAGQERFRSITKQYFRKADGVLIMYDVSSESSFLNVRNWVDSVQEGTEDGTVMVLVGNKTDLAEDDDNRVVKTKDGVKLADEFGALFYETSAKTGVNVAETLDAMASILREREDREIEKALNLQAPSVKKTGCCS